MDQEGISSQSRSWRVKAASVPGTHHRRIEQSCQDYHCWSVLPGGILVAAVADGAGSARFGGEGAALAAQTALETLRGFLRENGHNEASWHQVFHHALVASRQRLVAEAKQQGADLRDYGTTLILLVASPTCVGVAQIGDGAVVVSGRQSGLFSLTAPKREEFLDATVFLGTKGSIGFTEINFCQEELTHVAIMTDGLQMLALKMPEYLPHEPFFRPLWEFVDHDHEGKAGEEDLCAFLLSPRVANRCDDDITLVLASLVEYPKSGGKEG